MIFSDVFQSQPFFFYDGPMETRIEFGTNIKIDKEMSIFMLMNTQEGRDALAKLYRTDIQTALSFRQPIILNAPVFRASKEHCKRSNIPLSTTTIFDINREGSVAKTNSSL
ncbi:hypothetical protein [uncultured Legionella sp.]|uniref:hypothetical protein n=1 Tax=uncultured Legionella sp. TaxID=210934 RepID=UPI00260B801C|nr:hypothetical protein [uncultured Legionella sp.]